MTETMNSTTPQSVTVTLAFHPLDYASLQEACCAAGLSETAFCTLAIHRAARSIVNEDAFSGIV